MVIRENILCSLSHQSYSNVVLNIAISETKQGKIKIVKILFEVIWLKNMKQNPIKQDFSF